MTVIDFFLHLDVHLGEIIENYQNGTYAILFGIIFAETGLVVTPFLPGDSLLFAAGTFAARDWLDVRLLLLIFSVAAILGDAVNYWAGNFIGPRVFKPDALVLKEEYLERTHRFYEKHGGKAVILARYVPIMRTLVPFVAGIGAMEYKRFALYNVTGGLAWVFIFTLLGFFFGEIPAVEENFTLAIMGIILLSITPGIYEFVRHKMRQAKEAEETA